MKQQGECRSLSAPVASPHRRYLLPSLVGAGPQPALHRLPSFHACRFRARCVCSKGAKRSSIFCRSLCHQVGGGERQMQISFVLLFCFPPSPPPPPLLAVLTCRYSWPTIRCRGRKTFKDFLLDPTVSVNPNSCNESLFGIITSGPTSLIGP